MRLQVTPYMYSFYLSMKSNSRLASPTGRSVQQSLVMMLHVCETNAHFAVTALCEELYMHAAEGTGGISVDERLAIERSQGSSRGIASAVVALSEPVLASATAVAALSCEALRAQVCLLDVHNVLVPLFLKLTFQA